MIAYSESDFAAPRRIRRCVSVFGVLRGLACTARSQTPPASSPIATKTQANGGETRSYGMCNANSGLARSLNNQSSKYHKSGQLRDFASTQRVVEINTARMRPAVYFFGGLIIMCAPAVPGFISHGALSLALVDSPVVSVVAKGT